MIIKNFLKKEFKENSFAQGTIEYLVIVAIVVVISLVVVGLVTNFFGTSSQVISSSNSIGSQLGSGGISVLEGVTDSNGDVILRLQNNSGQNFSVSKIIGVSSDSNMLKYFDNVFFNGGDAINFSLDSLGNICKCNPNDQRKVCEFEITLTSSNGLTKKIYLTKSIDCVSNTVPAGAVVKSFAAEWAKGASIGDDGSDHLKPFSIGVDLNGNIYVAGKFVSGSVDFGGGVSLTNSWEGGNDIFIVKYNSSGVAQWARGAIGQEGYFVWGSPVAGNEETMDIFVDLNSNVYVVGYVDLDGLPVNFGGGNILDTGSYFLVKYNSDGNILFLKDFNSGYYSAGSYSHSVSVDSYWNVYVFGNAGTEPGTIDFGNGVTMSKTGTNSYDAFIVKYNSSGVTQWVKSIDNNAPGGYDAKPLSITVDNSNKIVVFGYCESISSSCIFAGGQYILNRRGSFLAKFDSGGNVEWVKDFNTDSFDLSEPRIYADVLGNIYVSSSHTAWDINFGDGVILPRPNIFLAKFNQSGGIIWAKGSSDLGTTCYVNDLAVDPNGNAFVFGSHYGPLYFGNDVSFPDSSGFENFLVKFDSSGNALFAKNFGSSNGRIAGVSDSSRNIFVSGFGSSQMDFGNGVTLSGKDWFLTKYN